MSQEITRRRTTDPNAIAALHRLVFLLDRLDRQARNPGPRGMVEVTAIMWRDQISPDIEIVRRALAGAGGATEGHGVES